MPAPKRRSKFPMRKLDADEKKLFFDRMGEHSIWGKPGVSDARLSETNLVRMREMLDLSEKIARREMNEHRMRRRGTRTDRD